MTITVSRRLRLTMQPHLRVPRYLGELRRQLAQHKMHDDVSIYKGLLFTEVRPASHISLTTTLANTLGQLLVQMAARVCKNIIRRLLRGKMRELRVPSSEVRLRPLARFTLCR